MNEETRRVDRQIAYDAMGMYLAHKGVKPDDDDYEFADAIFDALAPSLTVSPEPADLVAAVGPGFDLHDDVLGVDVHDPTYVSPRPSSTPSSSGDGRLSLDVSTLAEAIAVIDLQIADDDHEQRRSWREDEAQLWHAAAIADEYARLAAVTSPEARSDG